MFIRRTATSLKGQKFNHWLVIADFDPNHQKLRSLCRCDCGTEKYVEHSHLKSGKSKSCRKCSAKIVAQTTRVTHNMSSTKVYRAWQSMKTRCYNKEAESCYKYHGALGIRVCAEWLNSFEAFYEHIGNPPTKYHTIDRKDVYKDYEPGNVRWATQAEQMGNLRKHYPELFPSKLKRLFRKINKL